MDGWTLAIISILILLTFIGTITQNKLGIKDSYERFKERIALDDNPSEKLIIAIIGICTLFAVGDYPWSMWIKQTVSLADLFMLFIFAEVVAMIGAFYSTERISLRCP